MAVPKDDKLALDRAAVRLAQAVNQQWTDEVAVRRLRHPEPIRVCWSSTGRPSRLTLRGDASQVAELVRRLPAHQLVIIGRPGSGKTVLAILFTLAHVDGVAAGGTVPVLFTMSGWNPRQEHLHTWLSRRIAEDYPMLLDKTAYGPDAPTQLVRSGRVLPVLDGLDEMPPALVPAALAALDDALAADHGLVLTCRSREYEQAVAAAAAPLARAAVVEVEPVEPEDAIRFLEAAGLDRDVRWRPVAERLRTSPAAAVTTAMSTPLMISLARSVYNAPGADPADLCDTRRFPTRETIERHLLDQYVAAAYADRPAAPGARGLLRRYPPDRVERWLGLLAHHLSHRLNTTNLAWWQLGRAVPARVLGLLSGLTAASPMVAELLRVAEYSGDVMFTLVIWLATAVVVGNTVVRATRPQPALSATRSVLALLFRAIRDAFTVVVVAAPFIVYSALLLSGSDAPGLDEWRSVRWRTENLDRWFVETVHEEALVAAAIAGVLSLGTGAIAMAHTGGPRRFSARLDRLGDPIARGIAAGLLAGLPIGLLVRLFYGAGPGAMELAMINGIAVTVGIGLPVTLGRWLQTPVNEERTLSPRSVLRDDRRATLSVAAMIGVSFALCLAFVFVALLVVDRGAPLKVAARQLLDEALYAGVAGTAVGFIAVLASGSAWTSYSVARIWLAIWGRLPWRLMRFLEDAHDRGVLRQAGAVYQIRHARLQESLAARHVTRVFVDAGVALSQSTPARRVLTAGVTIIACLVLLSLAVTLITLRYSDD